MKVKSKKEKPQVETSAELLRKTEMMMDKVSKTVEIALNKTQEMKQVNASHDDILSAKEVSKEPVEINNVSNKLTVMDVINLLVQTRERKFRDKTNAKLKKVNKYIHDINFDKYAGWLENSRQLTSGDNFILIGHASSEICEMVNASRVDEKFLRFTKKIFGEPTIVFAMNDGDIVNVQKAYKDLKKADALPAPKEIKKPIINKKKETSKNNNKKEFLKNLFGDKLEKQGE